MIICQGFWSCANRAVPSGGPIDETPPKVIWEKSTPNRLLRFEKKPIIITFDEWVKLNDPLNQILVSPPPEKRPDILLRGRSVIFTFAPDEILRNDATYTINFGQAIQDITESNVVKNFSFVFSTGDFIDSLIIAGTVVDAFSGLPIENATIMLYENMEDSVVFNEKPFYAAKTEKDGTFAIQNVKEGYFKVVTITDDNFNYLFNPETEKIGYLPEAINTSDTSIYNIRLSLSQQLPDLTMNRVDSSAFNHLIIPFNREPYEIDLYFDSLGQEVYFINEANQIQIWHRTNTELHWKLYLKDTITAQTDTFSVRSRPVSENIPVKPIQDLSVSGFNGHPANPYNVCFTRPVQSVDSSFLRLTENDSIVIGNVIGMTDIFPATCLNFSYKWQSRARYEIAILPGGLQDYFGLTNDTIIKIFRVNDPEEYGNIYINLEELNADHSYLVQLMERDQEIKSTWVDRKSYERVAFQELRPGNYTLVVIHDRNHNKRWDPVDYLKKREPEAIMQLQMEQLRANWDLDVTVKWPVDL